MPPAGTPACVRWAATHMRDTPKHCGSIGAFIAAEIARPSIRRVSAGSMLTSSDNRTGVIRAGATIALGRPGNILWKAALPDFGIANGCLVGGWGRDRRHGCRHQAERAHAMLTCIAMSIRPCVDGAPTLRPGNSRKQAPRGTVSDMLGRHPCEMLHGAAVRDAADAF